MDNDNFSYTFIGASGVEWTVIMEDENLSLNGVGYDRQDDDPTYDFAIAMHKVINDKS